MGVINRSYACFKRIHILKFLYCSLGRSVCKYNSIIWSPYQSGQKWKRCGENFYVSFRLNVLDLKNVIGCKLSFFVNSNLKYWNCILYIENYNSRINFFGQKYWLFQYFGSFIPLHSIRRTKRSKDLFPLSLLVTNYISNTSGVESSSKFIYVHPVHCLN